MRPDLGQTLEDEEQVPGRGCALEPVGHTGGRAEEKRCIHSNQGRVIHTMNCGVLNGDTAGCFVGGCSLGGGVKLQNVGFQDCCGEEWAKMGAHSRSCCCAGGVWDLQAGGEM